MPGERHRRCISYRAAPIGTLMSPNRRADIKLMRSLSTVISALAVAVCACAIATQASAATVSPSVTVQLTDAGVADGWRTVRVEVTGNCGPDAPDGTTMDVRPLIVARWKDTSKAPYTPDEKMVEIVDAPTPPDPDDDEGSRPGPTATFTFRVTGGIHAVGKGEVVCTAPVPLGEFGEPTDDPHPKKAV